MRTFYPAFVSTVVNFYTSRAVPHLILRQTTNLVFNVVRNWIKNMSTMLSTELVATNLTFTELLLT